MLKTIYFYFIIFFSGACVLAIEILGTRVLAPFYGVSLFLWSALITITLIALSIGYAVGGYWADKKATMARLCSIIMSAGVWLLLLPFLKKPVLIISEPLGLRFAVLFAAFILFTPPLTLLGMVSPYAIKVKATSFDNVGRTAGNLYAISTIGSVIAALLTGFVLIPNIGVSKLILVIGLSLIISAAIGFGLSKQLIKQTIISSIIFICLGISITAIYPEETVDLKKGVLAVEYSPYADLKVIETKKTRFLMLDGSPQNIVDAKTLESQAAYSCVFELFKYFFDSPGDLLLVGVGAGVVVKSFAKSGWKIDAVEIDSEIIKLAHEFFGLSKEYADYYSMDGRQFLITHEKKYNLVILDAFGSSYIPFHLITKENFELIKSHLLPNGMIGLNIISDKWDETIVKSVVATLQTLFSNVWVLPTGDPPGKLNNVIIFAGDQPFDFKRPYPFPEHSHFIVRNMNQAWGYRFVPETENAIVLTDEYNPVDLWSEQINYKMRKVNYDYFRKRNLLF